MKTNKSALIQKVRTAYAEKRRLEAVVRRQYKSEMERCNAIAELILDDIAAEGIDPNSELGTLCFLALAEQYRREMHEALRPRREIDRGPLSDDFTRGRF